MSWITGGRSTPLAGLMALRPNLAADLDAFSQELWCDHGVDAVTLELCRLRVAMLHRCASALAQRSPQAVAAGLSEAQVAQLGDWHRAAAFSARERACIALAEQFVLDPSGIDESLFAPVRDALGEAGAVTLLEAFAVFDGFTRFQVMLQAAAPAEAAA
jgi:alkylhydroperoxidase family enzyme